MGVTQSLFGFSAEVSSLAGSLTTSKDAEFVVSNPKRPLEVVIIAVDQSQHSQAAFEWYCKHIHQPNDVVHVVHCEEIEFPNYPAFAITASQYADSIRNAKKVAEGIIAGYEARLKELKITGNVHTEIGKPGEVLIKSADQYKATHIIIGTRGFGLIRRTILGSVSDYVIHHTKIPVTVVPSKATRWFF